MLAARNTGSMNRPLLVFAHKKNDIARGSFIIIDKASKKTDVEVTYPKAVPIAYKEEGLNLRVKRPRRCRVHISMMLTHQILVIWGFSPIP